MSVSITPLPPGTMLPAHETARRRIRLLVTVLGLTGWCFYCVLPASAAPGSWTQRREMPARSSCPASCVVDGTLYVMGGHYPYATALKTVWAYDPTADSWTRKQDMPSPRRFAAATVVDGIVYVVGGTGVGWVGSPILPVAAYDPRADTWTNRASMPTGRGCLAVCAVNGLVYAIGGTRDGNQKYSTVEVYDPKADRWSTKKSLPKAADWLTGSVVGGIVYVFGGSETFAYDPERDHWTSKAPFSPYSLGPMSATVDGLIFLFGGMSQDLSLGYDFTQVYDPATDQFTARRRMPRTRATGACGIIDGKIYLAGGVSKEPVINPDAIYYKTLDVFDPQGGVAPRIVSAVPEGTNRLKLVWEAERGLKYGVESTPTIDTNRWMRMQLPTGLTVVATNGLVGTSCLKDPGEPSRFYRVVEAN